MYDKHGTFKEFHIMAFSRKGYMDRHDKRGGTTRGVSIQTVSNVLHVMLLSDPNCEKSTGCY